MRDRLAVDLCCVIVSRVIATAFIFNDVIGSATSAILPEVSISLMAFNSPPLAATLL